MTSIQTAAATRSAPLAAVTKRRQSPVLKAVAVACTVGAATVYVTATSSTLSTVLYILALLIGARAWRERSIITLSLTVAAVVMAGHMTTHAAATEPAPSFLDLAIALFGVCGTALVLRSQRSSIDGIANNAVFRTVMETAADAIIVIDTGGRIRQFNEGAERLFGYKVDDMLGKNVSMLMPEAQRSAHDKHIETYLRTGKTHIIGEKREVDILRRDGVTVPVSLSVGEVKETDQRYFIGIIHDISRSKLTEQILHQLHEITATPMLLLDPKINRVLELGTRYFDMEMGMLCCMENGILSIRNMAPPTTRLEEDAALTAAYENVLGTVASQGAIRSEGGTPIAADPSASTDDSPDSYFGIPVVVDWRLFGVLCFISSKRRARPITQGDRDMLQLLAHWIAMEVGRETQIQALSDAQEQLRRQAQTDGLTESSNRRHFMETAHVEFGRACRYEHEISLILIDADHFKRINDTHGHAVGDAVLIAIAKSCSALLRGSDLFGRIGGEEFALLLPETSLLASSHVAERIRDSIAALSIPAGDESVCVTVSLGIAARQTQDVDIMSVMRRADRALYQAKTQGRNRCVAA